MKKTIYLKDYSRPPAQIVETHLFFNIQKDITHVRSALHIQMCGAPTQDAQDLILDGVNLALLSVHINDHALSPQDYHLDDQHLTIPAAVWQAHSIGKNGHFILAIENTLNPDKNTALEGLFASNGRLFTQCEPEGFRHITYYLDRPDVMSTYTVHIQADKTLYPIILSNGNLQSSHSDASNTYATWHDPFAKPCYLFALVAGDFYCHEEKITTPSGEKLLQIFVNPQDHNKTTHAMNSLKKSIDWDLKTFGLDLDLERFMIVATPDFNMGAMENKGLNIFNAKYVLASPDVATDMDYANVESVIAHEYFHNWTGNRVTCRDWFQLSLKEGLTVYRDQWFTQDQLGKSKRLDDIHVMKTMQFAEDQGPMAHAVQPQFYQEINNFYTMTIYEKGAELVGMYASILGEDGFKKGLRHYLQAHDGQAATCEDFLQAMRDANPTSAHLLDGFMHWYHTVGTPRLAVLSEYDAKTSTYTLHFQQHIPQRPENTDITHLPIPINIALLSKAGGFYPLNQEGDSSVNIVLQNARESHSFTVPELPIPSLLRSFTAPIEVIYPYKALDLMHIVRYETDAYQRWQGLQTLWLQYLQHQVYEAMVADGSVEKFYLPNTEQQACSWDEIIDTIKWVVCDTTLPHDIKAKCMALPDLPLLTQACRSFGIHPHHIYHIYHQTQHALAQHLYTECKELYELFYNAIPLAYDYSDLVPRQLQNRCMHYLTLTGHTEHARVQYQTALHLSNRLPALQALCATKVEEMYTLLDEFYDNYQHEDLVVDAWFAIHAKMYHDDATSLAHIKHLLAHKAFNTSPNRFRSLLGNFCLHNPAFHTQEGYSMWQSYVLDMDKRNPQMAARLLRYMELWQDHAQPYRSMMQEFLIQLQKQVQSSDAAEVLQKILPIDLHV